MYYGEGLKFNSMSEDQNTNSTFDFLRIKEGDWVHYVPRYGVKENGRVKSIGEDYAFVVFKCAGEWDRYEDYTGQRTKLIDIKSGWVAEDGSFIDIPDSKKSKKECDHHYIRTNYKYKDINHAMCCHCGHEVNN